MATGSKRPGLFIGLTSPGKDKKKEKTEDTMSVDFNGEKMEMVQFMEMVKKSVTEAMDGKWEEKFDTMQGEVSGMRGRLEEVAKAAEEARALALTLKQKVEVEMASKEDVKKEIEGAKAGTASGLGFRNLGAQVDEKRKMEMIMGGMGKDLPRQDIIEKVRNIMVRSEVAFGDIWTFEKFSSIAVVQFPNEEAKRGFKKWLGTPEGRGAMDSMGDGLDSAWAGDNLGKEEREKKKALGKVKKALAEQRQSGDGLEVDYKRFKAYLGNTVVAQVGEDGRLWLEEGAQAARDLIIRYIQDVNGTVEVV